MPENGKPVEARRSRRARRVAPRDVVERATAKPQNAKTQAAMARGAARLEAGLPTHARPPRKPRTRFALDWERDRMERRDVPALRSPMIAPLEPDDALTWACVGPPPRARAEQTFGGAGQWATRLPGTITTALEQSDPPCAVQLASPGLRRMAWALAAALLLTPDPAFELAERLADPCAGPSLLGRLRGSPAGVASGVADWPGGFHDAIAQAWRPGGPAALLAPVAQAWMEGDMGDMTGPTVVGPVWLATLAPKEYPALLDVKAGRHTPQQAVAALRAMDDVMPGWRSDLPRRMLARLERLRVGVMVRYPHLLRPPGAPSFAGMADYAPFLACLPPRATAALLAAALREMVAMSAARPGPWSPWLRAADPNEHPMLAWARTNWPMATRTTCPSGDALARRGRMLIDALILRWGLGVSPRRQPDDRRWVSTHQASDTRRASALDPVGAVEKLTRPLPTWLRVDVSEWMPWPDRMKELGLRHARVRRVDGEPGRTAYS